MTSPQVDPSRCPLCGLGNQCGMLEGAATCWCFAESLQAEVLSTVAPEAQNVACVCRDCAGEGREPAPEPDQFRDPVSPRAMSLSAPGEDP